MKLINFDHLEEQYWNKYSVKPDREWPGYTQIFHSDDPHLPPPPWHKLDWIHAAGGDTAFQKLWPHNEKVRLQWCVLHLGDTSTNWHGRITPMIDGSSLPIEVIQQRLDKNVFTRNHKRILLERLNGKVTSVVGNKSYQTILESDDGQTCSTTS